MLTTPLDTLLGAYESRTPRLAPAEIERRRADMELGRHLNRIQGLEPDAVSHRLVALFVSGRISADEYRSLVATIARQNLRPAAPA